MPFRVSFLLSVCISFFLWLTVHAQTPAGQTPPAVSRVPPPVSTSPAVRVVSVGESDNEKSVTLLPGQALAVSLGTNPSTAFIWNLVAAPDQPLCLLTKPSYVPTPHQPFSVGSAGTTHFLFGVEKPVSYDRAFYLRFLCLRPFEQGLADARLWEIRVILPADPTVKTP